jgi:hypothetical protein
MKFRFVQKQAVWHLVEESRPNVVIATLKNDVEILALREFCEHYAMGSEKTPQRFRIECRGKAYTVTPIRSNGERLTLLISGSGGESYRLETEFTLSSKAD